MFDENLTTQQQEQIMKYLIKCYKQSSNRIKRAEACNTIQENEKLYLSDKTTRMLVDDALNELSPDEREIIVNCYIDVKKEGWYLDYFSRSTFYRLKSKAVNKFLHCLHV